jgi:spermidine/putrescine transport system permease protein
VFAISIDDFVISAFLSAGQRTEPVPVLIYSSARAAPTPSLNAVATVMLVFSMLAICLAALVQRRFRPQRGRRGGASVEDFARLDF